MKKNQRLIILLFMFFSFGIGMTFGQDPIIICPSDITISNDDDYTDTDLTGVAVGEDMSGSVDVEYNDIIINLNDDNIGFVRRRWNIDGMNQIFCDQTIILHGPPGEVNCNQNIVASLSGADDGGKAKLYTETLIEGSQNIDGLQCSRDGVLYGDFVEYFCCDIGTHTFYVKGTDANGTVIECSGEIEIEDKLAPAIDNTFPIYLALFGQSSVELTEDMLSFLVYDNCEVTSMTFSQSVFNSEGTYTVDYSVSDLSGNTSNGDITVIVISGNAIVCNNNVNVSTDANGVAIITPDMILEGPIPVNGQYQLSVNGGAFQETLSLGCGEPGQDEVQVTVQESTTGNQCWSSLLIEDLLPPLIDIQSTVYLSLNGEDEVELTAAMLSSFVTEGCNISSHNFSQSLFTTAGSYVINYTVTDDSGNASAQSFDLVVTDNLVSLACFDLVEVELDNQGNASITPETQLAAIYLNYDNNLKVGIGDSEEDIVEFYNEIILDCSSLGQSTIKVKEEMSGNTCWGQIIVKDSHAPTPYANSSVVVSLNGSEPYVLDPSLIDAGSFDNCEVASMIVTPNTFYTPGTYEVKLRVYDTSGNSDFAMSTVIVEQGSGQSIECIGISTALTEPFGSTTLWAEDFVINNEDFDSFSMAVNPTGPYTESYDFDCSMFDLNSPIDVYVRGENDSEYSLCSVSLTLVDVTPPVAITEVGVTLQLINGQATLYPEAVDDGSYDFCGSVSFSLSQSIFTTADIGDNLVTLTVTDASGNWNQGIVTVTVLDDGSTSDCTISSVLFPGDIIIFDEDGVLSNLSVENLQSFYGYTYPEVHAITLLDCNNMAYSYTDLVIPFPGGIKVLRTWTAIDWFTAEVGTHNQLIKLNTATNNSIACLETVTINVENGIVEIFPEDVLAGDNYDFDVMVLEILDENGNVITNNMISPNYVGMTLTYQVTDTVNDNSCWGNILVLENQNGCPLDVENEVTFPLDEIFISNSNLDPVEYSPENLVANFGFEESDVNIIISSFCAIAGYVFEDEVFNYSNGSFKIIRTFTLIDWLTYDPPSVEGIYTHIQTINVGFNPNDFICDVLPNSAPVGDCDTGHTLEDDVEWPSDLSIADYRITPEELIAFSNVEDIDAMPIFYNTPDDYSATYIDILENISNSILTINRVWKVEKESFEIVWHYSQTIVIDFTDFDNLVTVNTTNSRALSGVIINDDISTNVFGIASVQDDIVSIEYEDEYRNGLNVRDMVITHRHILGLETLEDQYLYAADVDGNSNITASDLLLLKKRILGIDKEYEWSFFDSEDNNDLPISPKASYTAFKRGDVDDNAKLEGSEPHVVTSKLEMDDLLINNGESYSIPVYLNENYSLFGLELRIGVDPELIDIVDVTDNMGFWDMDYHINDDNELVVFSTNLTETSSISDAQNNAVINIEIQAKMNGLLNEALEVDGKISYGVDENLELVIIGGKLNGVIGTGTNDSELSAISSYPNPTSDYLNIDNSRTGISGDMIVELFSLNGRMLSQTINETRIDVTQYEAGMYYYRVKIQDYQTTRKFIVVR